MDFAFLAAAEADEKDNTSNYNTAKGAVTAAAGSDGKDYENANKRAALAVAIRCQLEAGAAAWEGRPATALERASGSLTRALRWGGAS